MKVPGLVKSIGCFLLGAGIGGAVWGWWRPALLALMYVVAVVWFERVEGEA